MNYMHYMALQDFYYYYMLDQFTCIYIRFHVITSIYMHYMLNCRTRGF